MSHAHLVSIAFLALTACNGGPGVPPSDASAQSGAASVLQAECQLLQRSAQNQILGHWYSDHEFLSFSFEGRADGSPETHCRYNGPATFTPLRTRKDGDIRLAWISAGEYRLQLRFRQQNHSLLQALISSPLWLEFEIQKDFDVQSERFKIRRSDTGQLLLLSLSHHQFYDPGDQAGILRDHPFWTSEGFSLSWDMRQEPCLAEHIACLESPGLLPETGLAQFRPVTITADGKSYRHLFGGEIIEHAGARYRLSVPEASGDPNKAMCPQLPPGHHLRILLALTE